MLTSLYNTSQSRNSIQKKVMITVLWSSSDFNPQSFIKPGKTITAEKIVEKLMKCTRNLHANSQLLSIERPLFFSIIMVTRQKLQTLNCEVLDLTPYSHELLPTDFHFFKHFDNFLQEKCFKNPKYAETAFNKFVTSRTFTFYDTGIKKFCEQKCIEANCAYFY